MQLDAENAFSGFAALERTSLCMAACLIFLCGIRNFSAPESHCVHVVVS